jgi:hypothetical protein
LAWRRGEHKRRATHTPWLAIEELPEPEFVAIALVFALVDWFIYWLNQYAVRKELEPRRKELQTLLSSLNEPDEA